MSTTVTIIVVLAILVLVISILVYIYRCRRRNQLSHVLPTTTTTPICPFQQQTRQITPPLPSFQCPSQKQQHPSSQIPNNYPCNIIPTKPEFSNTPTHRSTPTNTTTSQSLTKPARIPSRTLLQHAGFTDPTPPPPPQIGLRSHATTRIGKRGFLDDFFDDDENGHDDSAGGGLGGGGGGGLESEQTTFVSEHSVRAFSGWFGSVSVRGGLSGRGSRGSGSEVGGGGGGGFGGNVGNNGSGTRLGMPLPKSGSDGYLG